MTRITYSVKRYKNVNIFINFKQFTHLCADSATAVNLNGFCPCLHESQVALHLSDWTKLRQSGRSLVWRRHEAEWNHRCQTGAHETHGLNRRGSGCRAAA